MKKILTLCLLALIQNTQAAANDVDCLQQGFNTFLSTSYSQMLEITNCSLVETKFPAVVEFIQQHPEISYVDFSNDNLSSKSIASLSQLPIQEAHLQQNAIDDAGAAALANSSVHWLVLDNNPITDAGFAALQSKQDLYSLTVSYTNITEKSCAVAAQNTVLRDIEMAGDHLTAACAKLLSGNTKAQLFVLSNNPIGDEGVASLSTMTQVISLSLANTGITDNALKSIATMPALSYLNIRHNNLTDAGMNLLVSMSGLTDLYLSENNLSDAGLDVSKIPGLMLLDISNSNITDKGAAIISDNVTKYHDKDGFKLSIYLSNNPALTAAGIQLLKNNPLITVG